MDKIKRKVVKCDLNGNIVSEFKTLVDAGNEIGVTKHIIFKCCKNQKKIVNEHTYRYVDIIEDLVIDIIKPVKCPYCDKTFDNYNGLSKHVISFKKHGEISQEKLLLDYKYEGKKPLCACGCGKETEISYSMGGGIHFNELIKGHYSRVHNNWGHNQKAINNSAETRRSKFKSGEIEQWNKGRNWVDTYNEEQIEKLSELYKNPIRGKKISDSLKIKNKESYMKEMHSRTLRERLENGKWKSSSKAEDSFAINFLDDMNISYERQKYIKDIKQYCDFYIKNRDKEYYLEFDGDFWHCNPIKYPNGPIHKFQERKLEKDKIKNKWMSDNNKTIIHIWESDVKNNEELVLKLLEPLLD